MQILEVLLLLAGFGVAAFALARLRQPSRAVMSDQAHVATLIGTMDGGTVNVREKTVAPGWFARVLASAGIEAPPVLLGIVLALFGVIVALAVSMYFPGVMWAYPIIGVLAIIVVLAILQDVGRWRSTRFENRLADAVDLMVGALTAGETPVDAIASAAAGSLEPVKSEFEEVVQRLRASVPIERALRPMVTRYDSEGVRLFTQLLIAKWEIGGPIAPALQAVNRSIRQGVRLRWQLGTQVSNAQNAAVVVALLPYALVAFFVWKRPETMARLWAYTWGPHLFLAAVILQIVGFLWLRRILRTEM